MIAFFFPSCKLICHNLFFGDAIQEDTAAQKLASVIYNALVKIDPSLKDRLASDLQCKEEHHIQPRAPLFRKNAFLVEHETESNNDNDGRGSASHDQYQRALLNYCDDDDDDDDDDDSAMGVDEDQEDFFQLNII